MSISFAELRRRVMSAESTDVRQQLADTLEALDQLEADFHRALVEIATSNYDRKTESYQTSRAFDQMCQRRGVEYPG